MWADRLERFDEIATIGVQRGMVSLVDKETGRVGPQKFFRAANLDDFYRYVGEALRTYDGYFVPSNMGDPFWGVLPNAFLIQTGMKLVNPETDERYTIGEVVRDAKGNVTGEVRLDGEVAPSESDTLVFDRDCGIQFARVSHRNTAGVDFEEDATRKDTPTPYCAYIDFSVLEEVPGQSDPNAPRPVRFRKPMHREAIVESTEVNTVLEIKGQWFDSLIRFDLWAATSAQAEQMVYWFYNFMTVNHWIFKLNGVKEVLFERRGLDQPVGKWRQNLFHRPVDYFVRTEQLFVATGRKLEHISLYTQIRQDELLEEAMSPLTGRPRFLGDQFE